MVSLACGLMPILFVMVLMAGNVFPSWPTWPMRRELMLGAEGGETTGRWFLEVIQTFKANGGLVGTFHATLFLCSQRLPFLFGGSAAIDLSSFCRCGDSLERVGMVWNTLPCLRETGMG
jgi:hypothetical protein